MDPNATTIDLNDQESLTNLNQLIRSQSQLSIHSQSSDIHKPIDQITKSNSTHSLQEISNAPAFNSTNSNEIGTQLLDPTAKISNVQSANGEPNKLSTTQIPRNNSNLTLNQDIDLPKSQSNASLSNSQNAINPVNLTDGYIQNMSPEELKKHLEQDNIQFTLKNPPSAMQITLQTISPHAATTPRQQYLLQPLQPITIPYTPKFYIGSTRIRLSIQRIQEFDVVDGKVEVVLLGKKEKKTSRFVPIKAATVDDLKRQLDEKKKEATQEIERIEEEYLALKKENEKLARNRDEFKASQEQAEKEVLEAEERLAIARQRESDKNEVTRQLRESLKQLEDELRSETEKLEAIQKTKVNTENIIFSIFEDIEKKRVESKRLEKLTKSKEIELQNGKERLENLKQIVAESDKGTLQQVKDLEEKIKQIDANHDAILKHIIQDVDQVKRESDRFMKQAETAKQKLVKTLSENRKKLNQCSPEIVEEIFELRAAIQLKKFNEKYLVEEIESLLTSQDLETKIKEAESYTAEQFMLKKTKYEAEIVDYLQELSQKEFKLTKDAFINENDYLVVSDEEAKQFEENAQKIMSELSIDHIDLDVLMEYLHIHKLLSINKKITEEVEKSAKKVAYSNGDDFDLILKQIEENIDEQTNNSTNDLVIRESKLKPDENLKIYQLEDFVKQKPKVQEKGMEKLRINVKQNLLSQWRKKIRKSEDLLQEKELV